MKVQRQNLMRITDDIPGLFEAPDLETMKISVAGKELENGTIQSWKLAAE